MNFTAAGWVGYDREKQWCDDFPDTHPIVENPYAGRVGRPPWLRIQLLTVLKTRGPLPLGTLAKTCKRKPSRLMQPLQALRADGWVELAGDDWQIRQAA